MQHITTKQQEILKLLYRYRFLNRIQIQTLMHHKDYKTINVWLKDLKEKEYVIRIYSTGFTEKTKPAVYYLATNGIRFLKSLDIYPIAELRKRYREHDRSEGFISRSVAIAACCINLQAASGDTARYECHTQADMADPDDEYYFLLDPDTSIHPHLHFVQRKNKRTTHYLLEIIETTLPHYRLRKLVKDYVTYLADEEWEGEEGAHPVTMLVLPTTYGLIYAKRRIRKLRQDVWDDEHVHVRLTTIDKLKQQGMLGDAWERA